MDYILPIILMLITGALSVWSLYVAIVLPLLAIRALRKYLRSAP